MKLLNIVKRMVNLARRNHAQLVSIQQALGRIEERQCLAGSFKYFNDYEYQVFSQWGEDGLIQHIINNVEIQRNIFVEFGVQDYTESNTRFLIKNSNWAGLVIDGSLENVEYIKNDEIYWRHNLKAHCEFITKDNINNILTKNGIDGDIGLLSVDIDGNDYWVWEAITCINPRIVVCEYNSVFGDSAAVTVPYDDSFVRNAAHYSNLYYGASISALNYLAIKKGYKLVGSNSAGNNLFFVREDVGQHLPSVSPQDAYIKSNFREGRDEKGKLLNITSVEGFKLIEDQILFDVKTKQEITVHDAVKY